MMKRDKTGATRAPKSGKSNKPQVWKGIVGLIVLLGMLIGGTVALVRYENNARLNASKPPQSASATPVPSATCHTLTEVTDFTTGNPKRDAIFAQVIKGNSGKPELTAFLDSYSKSKKVDESSMLWKAAMAKVPEKVEVKPYLTMDMSGQVGVKEDVKTSDYLMARIPYPDSQGLDFIHLRMALVDTKTKQRSSDIRDVVAAVNSNDPHHVLVFAVHKSDNGNRDGFTPVGLKPIC